MRAAKVDANQSAIVAALRAAGCSVQSLARLGDGVPDLLVGRGGEQWLLEIKRPSGPRGGKGGALTPDQIRWWQDWRGRRPVIVTTPQEALAAVGLFGQADRVSDRACHSLEDIAERLGA